MKLLKPREIRNEEFARNVLFEIIIYIGTDTTICQTLRVKGFVGGGGGVVGRGGGGGGGESCFVLFLIYRSALYKSKTKLLFVTGDSGNLNLVKVFSNPVLFLSFCYCSLRGEV